MLKNIVVPLDGSDLARRALEPALGLAGQAGGTVTLVRVPVMAHMVVPADSGYAVLYPEQSLEHSAKQAQDYLETLRAALAAGPQPAGTARVQIEVRRGDVAEAIAGAAAAHEAGLIVMSSHGYSGFTRWLLGSVAEKALRIAPCPVLVVRSPEPLRHMLVPLDGSPLSEGALGPALEVAAALGLKVTLLRAVPTVDSSEMEHLNHIERGFGRRVEEELVDAAKEYLQELSRQHSRAGLKLETTVRFEPAAEAILEFAETHAADLIAMATHGRTGLQRWVYGSVTEKVLRGAPHSMLVVRSPAWPGTGGG
jgi:nucleotide-binding universal stress UspA family protein